MNVTKPTKNLPQNISFSPMLPVIHAHSLGVSLSNLALWQHARQNKLVIVSKDAELSHRIMLAAVVGGAPAFWQSASERFSHPAGAAVSAIKAPLPAHKLVNVYARTASKR